MNVVVLALLVLASLSAGAHAQKETLHSDSSNHFSIAIPQKWQARPKLPQGNDGLLAAYSAIGGRALSLTRISFSNLPAWWKKDRQAFFDQVIRGASKHIPGYRFQSKKTQRVGRVPTQDFHFVRTGPRGKELVWMRFLFYRRFALVATGASPAKATRAQRLEVQKFARSLRPFTD